MSNNTAGNDRSGEGNVRRLSDAVRRIRIAETERADAFADLHEADRARLGLLVEELAGVFAELPDDDEYFVCEIGGSSPPRLWVDPTSHVAIGRDRRSYRFVKDTRLGRVVLVETTDVTTVADAVTSYIAERLVERERAAESDYLVARLRSAVLPERGGRSAAVGLADGETRSSSLLWSIVLFLAGFTVGALGLVAYAWFMVGT
jgi:hypothetical protein